MKKAILVSEIPLAEKLDKKITQLEGYSCKQLLKDPDLTLTLTLKVSIGCLACGVKGMSLRTEKVS